MNLLSAGTPKKRWAAGEGGLAARFEYQQGVVVPRAEQVVAVVGVRAGQLCGRRVSRVADGLEVRQEHLSQGVPVDEEAVDGAGVVEFRERLGGDLGGSGHGGLAFCSR